MDNFGQKQRGLYVFMIANPVNIRPEAREQIVETLRANKIPDTYGLRVGIRGGGCGASWLLGFDVPTADDEVFLIDGVRIIIDKRHMLYVLGAEIGYQPGGFVIEKPTG